VIGELERRQTIQFEDWQLLNAVKVKKWNVSNVFAGLWSRERGKSHLKDHGHPRRAY
jgi:hypothetical protein